MNLQRRVDLRAESASDANYFFWAAGLAALGTGLLPIRLNIVVSIGTIDLLTFYARPVGGELYRLVVSGCALAWVLVIVGLGFAARSGYRWAFLVGIVLYGADMIALLVTFSIWAFTLHAVFIFKWFHGQRTLKEVSEPLVLTT